MSELRIPDEAMPVVEILRREVERPTAEIYSDENTDAPRFECGKCPMGLLPSALSPTPAYIFDFDDSSVFETDRPIENFYEWWDCLTVAEAYQALDLIWPKEN